MPLTICAERQKILDEAGPVLVTGGPGSGKTTIALEKARQKIEAKLSIGQNVLFLSFSRAAVARVAEASKSQLSRGVQKHLSIQTFHSFFWGILKAHGYLLGAPRALSLLLPHDEDALRKQFEDDGGDWEAERERLFIEQGIVAFDLFAPKACTLLAGSKRLLSIYAARYPLIIVDEAQDTAEDQWNGVCAFAGLSQLVCLADLDQQIYDFRPGVSSKRVTDIMEALSPLRVDLEGQNHRSPDSEIVAFGNDILLGTPRGSAYKGVSRHPYNSGAQQRDKAIRSAVGMAMKMIAKPGEDAPSLAILSGRKLGVTLICRALAGDGTNKHISHKAYLEEGPILLSSRMIAFLMEPRLSKDRERDDLAEALELAANVFRARGKRTNLDKARGLALSAVSCRNGKSVTGVAAKLLACLRNLREQTFTGDPRKDWIAVREALRNCGASPFALIAETSEQMAAFHRSRRITDELAELWQTQRHYGSARKVLDAVIADVQLMEAAREDGGIHVMTMHKSKGKEFDAVILFDNANSSPFNFSNEAAPYPRCRKLLRVGITRARHHVLLLTDRFTPPDLLTGHRL